MLSFLLIAGGVAFVLFGVRYLREGLDRIFGDRLGTWMQRLACDPIRAALTGLGISLVAPSSTTMSILAVQTVQSGELSARQMLAIMLGADVGMTITVQLLALHIEQYAPLFALLGVPLFYFARAARWRGTGQVLLSLALLFMGIGVIKAQASGIDPNGDLVQLLQIAERYPLAMVILSAILANLLQSSTATIGLIIAVGSAQSSAMPMGLALAGVVGANLGVTLTTLLAGWRQIESRRLALGNLVAKLGIAAVIIFFLPALTTRISKTPGSEPAQIANAHTAFNLIKLIVFLPIVRPLSSLIERCTPIPSGNQSETFGPKYLGLASADGGPLAMGQSMREIMRLAEIVRTMLDDLWRAMDTDDEELACSVSRRDDQVDLLDKEIRKYLIQLASRGLEADQAAEQMRQLRYLAELETIGDIIDKNLSELVLKKIRHGVRFSEVSRRELEDFDQKVLENLLIADTAFHTRDRVLAEKLLRHKNQLDSSIRELFDRHFARLNAGMNESLETTSIHLDLLTNLRRINSHVSHVAYSVLHDLHPRQATA